MGITIEKTDEAIWIKLPPDTAETDIKHFLSYFSYVNLVSKSQAKQEEIDELAREVKKGWWEKNKARFKGITGFEDLT